MLKAFIKQRIALVLTMTLGVGLSILFTLFVSKWEVSNRQLRFQRQIENLGTALQRSLNRYTDMLAFIDDYYKVVQLPVNRQGFASFVERSLQAYPGIQALEWAPIIRQKERFAYEQKMRLEGYKNFQISELGDAKNLVRAAKRPYYLPVTYIEPFTGNESALGYDLNSDITRAIAIAQTKETGKTTATGRITLVQERRNQFSFLIFLPIYEQHKIPNSIALRSQQFKGVLLGVFRVSDVVEGALQDLQYEIDFTVYDQSSKVGEQFLGRYDAVEKKVIAFEEKSQSNLIKSELCPSPAACQQTLTIGQRQWLITFSPSANYPVETQYGKIYTPIIGFLMTAVLVIFLHNLNNELELTKSLGDLRFRFFSMASHELRTPLSIILLSSESLQINYDQLTAEQKQANIQRINMTAKRMSQQIADLLMLTRAEVRQLEFNPELLDLECFCQQVVDEMQMGVNQQIEFTSNCPNTKAFLDKKLLQSLLTNLLSNAAKYSPFDAPIQLNLSCNETTATMQICDRGIGIPTSDRTRIWEPFYRGSNVGEVTGSGLGLAVVKTCVELHRGEWAIASAEEGGTIVTVILPLE
ncbi:MAG TPA: CHASE domain-containing protein [Kamptonema sp.]|nr:CHASE domain-containing protein [Kamptonema sp.]